MNWARIAFVLSDVLSIVLTIRLIMLRLHDVYRVFCAFLIFQVLSESFVIVDKFTSLDRTIDYRIAWLIMQLISWILSIWMVYALLNAILRRLPGILRISRHALNVSLALALAIALVSARPEWLASGSSGDEASSIVYAVDVAFVLQRLVATIALLILLFTLAFVLWFPVAMPRNLAVFSVGFGIYFTGKTVLLLLRSFWFHEGLPLLNNGITIIECVCLIYWIIFINKSGETAPVTVGHSWQTDRQSELLNDLEHLNALLVRSGRR
jgi:hypothetical protein